MNLKRNIEELPTYECEFVLRNGDRITPSDAEEFCLLWDDDEELTAIEYYWTNPEGYYESHIVDTNTIAHIVETVDTDYIGV